MKRGSGEQCNIRPPPDGGVEHDYDQNNHGRDTMWSQWESQEKFIHSDLKLKSKLNWIVLTNSIITVLSFLQYVSHKDIGLVLMEIFVLSLKLKIIAINMLERIIILWCQFIVALKYCINYCTFTIPYL